MKPLTRRQTEILAFLKEFILEHKYPPTLREIATHYKISVKGAHDHIKALERKNYIHCNLHRSRTIEILDNPQEEEKLVSIPILGNVAAGIPLFTEANWDGFLSVPASMLKHGKHFALHIFGDSMQEAGILDGDIAIIQHQQIADNGSIVVALVNDEAVTLKRFFKEKSRIKLQAENPIYPPIYSQNVKILGRLVKIIRNYES